MKWLQNAIMLIKKAHENIIALLKITFEENDPDILLSMCALRLRVRSFRLLFDVIVDQAAVYKYLPFAVRKFSQ